MILGALLDAGLPLDALRAALGSLAIDRHMVSLDRVRKAGIAAAKFRVHDRPDVAETAGNDAARPQPPSPPPEPGGDRGADRPVGVVGRGARHHPTVVSPTGGGRSRHARHAGRAGAPARGRGARFDHRHRRGPCSAWNGSAPAASCRRRSTWAAGRSRLPTVYCPCRRRPPRGCWKGFRCIRAASPANWSRRPARCWRPSIASSFGPLPAMRIGRIGYGAGDRDLPGAPNVLRVIVGEEEAAPHPGDRVVVIECEIDDMNPQIFGPLMDRLYAAGAVEVFYIAVQMKKKRPGTLVTAVAPIERREALAVGALPRDDDHRACGTSRWPAPASTARSSASTRRSGPSDSKWHAAAARRSTPCPSSTTASGSPTPMACRSSRFRQSHSGLFRGRPGTDPPDC